MTSIYWKMKGELLAMKNLNTCVHCINKLSNEYALLHENEEIPNPIIKKGVKNNGNIKFGQMV